MSVFPPHAFVPSPSPSSRVTTGCWVCGGQRTDRVHTTFVPVPLEGRAPPKAAVEIVERWPKPQPIEQADKARRILGLIEAPAFASTGGKCWVICEWEAEAHARRPNPYWRMLGLDHMGKHWQRGYQPKLFIDLPPPQLGEVA